MDKQFFYTKFVAIFYSSKEYEGHFATGVERYQREDWAGAAEAMEAAAAGYLSAEEDCRTACERPFDMGWHPDFVTSIASEFQKLVPNAAL